MDEIFANSHSNQNFATKLMTQLFDKSELLRCRNVNGIAKDNPYLAPKKDEALDEKRVAIIRRLVQERAAPDKIVWSKCVIAMNKKIIELKAKMNNSKSSDAGELKV